MRNVLGAFEAGREDEAAQIFLKAFAEGYTFPELVEYLEEVGAVEIWPDNE
jgi:hypothetical protein